METTMTAASARKKMPCPTEGQEQATLFNWEQAAKIITDYMEGEYENK